MVLRRATSLRGALEGVCSLKIETFLGPEMATSESSATWAQKSRDVQNISEIKRGGMKKERLMKKRAVWKRQREKRARDEEGKTNEEERGVKEAKDSKGGGMKEPKTDERGEVEGEEREGEKKVMKKWREI
jgi:hypothetical protein